MSEILPFLKSLISVAGLSGFEGPVRELIQEEWVSLADEVSTSKLGSLHALTRGRGKGRRPSIMVATHMDSIGLMVRAVVDGFLKVYDVGGVDPRILPGTPVMVHGRRPLPGVIVAPPALTLEEDRRKGATALEHVMVDVGLPPRSVQGIVQIGDLVSFDTAPLELSGETLSGHTLDNRASVGALTVCLRELRRLKHEWDVWAVATSQEEETYGGAITSSYELRPDLGVVIDVTHAKGPGSETWRTVGLGKGPALGWGPNLHPFLYKRFEDLAKRLEIPYSMDLAPEHTGTDAYPIQVAREGIPTMLLSIPLRYMHTPVELIAIKDVQRAGRLLAEFIAGLGLDFISTMSWDEPDAAK